MRNKDRKGFTLVELSIVLVIIGLIIGGVLTGRQILQNAEITNALNAVQAFQAQFQTYVQNYGALPGNDSSATSRFPNGSGSVVNGSGSGTLQGAFDSTTATDETRLLWADLRAAGLVKSIAGADQTLQPPNPFGGLYGFQHGALGITNNALCLSGVPGDAAAAIDSRLDDGISSTGSVQAILTGTEPTTNATAATNYGSTQTYTVCIGM